MNNAGGAMAVGSLRGELAAGYRQADFLEAVQRLAVLCAASGPGDVVSAGRHRSVRMDLPCGGRKRPVVVKRFGPQSIFKDRIDARRGTKALRSWRVACHLVRHGVGTPAPVGYLERWRGGRLVESYWLTELQAGISSLAAELSHLFREEPQCDRFMALLETVAGAVRALHDAGVRHNDLGNQNILLRRQGPCTWGDVQFADLNRARVRARLTERDKARDISRLYLPSDFLRVFKEMYAGEQPTRLFQRWENWYRAAFAWHTVTRPWRHPVRRWRSGAASPPRLYPREKDMWVWDERSGQAVSVMTSRARRRHYPPRRLLRSAAAVPPAVWPLRRLYRDLLAGSFARPVALAGRTGVALHPTPLTAEREQSLLARLGRIPLLVRFYHHQTRAEWAFAAEQVRMLHRLGHAVSIALVQDRVAVLEPERWQHFVRYVLEQTAGAVENVEVGHAINRVKWGLWHPREHRQLLACAAAAARAHPGVRFMGPAAIDFEYPCVLAGLRNVPDGMRFDALSHHLYVDRRGAPENGQGPFSALEKFALARAIARWSPVCEDRLVVSEVNWPLRGTGVYSPVGSPYVSPGPRYNDPSVDEDTYADYMLRYLLTALCSGLVARVFWWRLAAHGYGLVDDLGPGAWRERPAYEALRRFLMLLGEATFVDCPKPLDVAPAGGDARVFAFRRRDGDGLSVAYAPRGPVRVTLPFEIEGALDAVGRKVPAGGRECELRGRPVYLFAKH